MSIRLKLAGAAEKVQEEGGGDPTDVEAGRRGLPRQFFNLISGSFSLFHPAACFAGIGIFWELRQTWNG